MVMPAMLETLWGRKVFENVDHDKTVFLMIYFCALESLTLISRDICAVAKVNEVIFGDAIIIASSGG